MPGFLSQLKLAVLPLQQAEQGSHMKLYLRGGGGQGRAGEGREEKGGRKGEGGKGGRRVGGGDHM